MAASCKLNGHARTVSILFCLGCWALHARLRSSDGTATPSESIRMGSGGRVARLPHALAMHRGFGALAAPAF